MMHDSFSDADDSLHNADAPWPTDTELGHLAEEAMELARCERLGDERPLIRRYVVWDDVYQEY